MSNNLNISNLRFRRFTRMLEDNWVYLVVLAAIILSSVFIWKPNAINNSVDTDRYQAVVLDDGKVYFGKLEYIVDGYAKISNVFYLQSKDGLNAADQSDLLKIDSQSIENIQLIKMGDEIHGPSDEMFINRDRIMFFENLKDDGKVSSTIIKYYEDQKE